MAATPQVITCKGAVWWGGGENDVKLQDIQVDPPKPTEARIKMLFASVCHTDLLRATGFPLPLFPRVLGHEGVGVVESIGEKVTDLEVGDVVIPTYIGECRECENCISRESNFCLKYPIIISGLMLDNTSRMSIGDQKIFHLFSCSTFAEYMITDANYLVKVDPNIDPAHASIISCGFSTGFGAVWKEAKVESGSSVAVFGLGGVGLGAISAAKMMGAAKIIGIDKNEVKRAKGEAFGMTDFVNPDASDKSASELVKELSGGMGVDYSFECTGVAPCLTQALQATKLGKGKTIVIGSVTEEFVSINFRSLLLGRTLKGSAFGGLKPKSDLPFIVDKCLKKEFPLHELLTHEVSLTDIDKALWLLKQPDCVKVVIRM
ncbi:8-hydroxygeraniol oxidoreductase-like [Prosopis cineraria]|uniref:8-hydroxygeraniol oxidoreductase-like n=1 Tax=Prosopis cineraria TaxID=364024 RepID=UPI00240FF044|nr:8-hydroxygeraniol oxidoreductase-like [Prosopis cineraria]XP_054796594.1 8-hydroxygeraniol oxidoreductase-like [Prosopis cineraria]